MRSHNPFISKYNGLVIYDIISHVNHVQVCGCVCGRMDEHHKHKHCRQRIEWAKGVGASVRMFISLDKLICLSLMRGFHSFIGFIQYRCLRWRKKLVCCSPGVNHCNKISFLHKFFENRIKKTASSSQ